MATVEVNNMTFTNGFTTSNHNKPVPNHLLETKIFSKVSENEVFQTCPSSIYFHGYEIGKTSKQTLKLTNISSQCQRMHIIPPTTSYFNIKYIKKEKLVPGFFLEITIEFTPKEWSYYHDCIRIHCQSNENLVVPIHGYPALKLSQFPKKLNFGSVPIGESQIRTITVKSDIPVDFEFQLNVLQSNPAITVEPNQGIITGCDTLDIKVSFSPTEFCTVHCKLQLVVSQFNTTPQICHITGTSAPGLKLRLADQVKNGSTKEFEESKGTTRTLDPVTIDPLYRSRLKKIGKSQKRTPPSELKNEEIIRDGIKFPKNLGTQSAVAYVLQQQPGKLKAKDVREAVKQKKDVPLSTKQLKETVFEYTVQQDVLEERQNKLRWCVKLGENEIADLERNKILEERLLAEKEYRVQRGDPVAHVEFERSSTMCTQRRIHRQANAVPELSARFDSFVNDNWTKRHRVLRKFTQASRKVVVRLRTKNRYMSLSRHLADWRNGKFAVDHTRLQQTESLDDILPPFRIEPEMVLPFSFPSFQSSDDKDDGITNSLDQLSVEPTVVQVESYIPYFNLKVPHHYNLLGYKPCDSQLSSIGFVSKHTVRPLRTGAEDEVINLVSTLPHTTTSDANILDIQTVEEIDDELSTTADNGIVSDAQPFEGDTQGDDVTTSRAKSRLVIPTEFFKQPKYHPLQIFNPLPGLHAVQPQVSCTKIDEDYHLCPLPRYKLENKSGGNKSPKALIGRPDVISGLMTWKRFPCQTLVTNNNSPKLTDVWVPRWNNPFVDDLLPSVTPTLLQELPEDDEMADIESHDDEVTDTAGNPIVLSPDMVKATFPLVDQSRTKEQTSAEEKFPNSGKLPGNNNPVSDSGLISRDEREKELLTYVRTQNDRLGRLVRVKYQEINNLLQDDHFKIAF